MTELDGPQVAQVEGEVFAVRIDSLLRSGNPMYFFVTKENSSKWNRWWSELFAFLCGFRSSASEWKFEPIQDVLLSRASLSPDQRKALLDHLKTAPEPDMTEHVSLRRTIKNLSARHDAVHIVFFKKPEPRDAGWLGRS